MKYPKAVKFDTQMCGTIKTFGDEEQFRLVFKENGRYYVEYSFQSIYIANYNDKEEIFRFFKIYDKHLNLASSFDEVRMALAQYFPFRKIC